MGSDTPRRAVIAAADAADYFQQLFAQVTNPPLDAIREEVVTSPRHPLARRATCATRRPLSSSDPAAAADPGTTNWLMVNSQPEDEVLGHRSGMRAAIFSAFYPVAKGGVFRGAH